MALFLEVKSDESAEARIRLSPGRNRINVRPGDTYRVVDDQTGFAPPGTTVKRVDSGIVIDGLGRAEGGEDVVVDLTEFYSTCSVSSPCSVVVQKDAGGAVTTVTPSTQPIGALADGSFVLYDPSYVAPEPVAVESSDGGLGRIALYGLGGLAIVGLAAGGSGGGGSDDGGGGTAPPDGILSLSSSPFVNSRTPVITGRGEPGATVTAQIDLNRDSTVDVRYQTTVAADGSWRIDLSSATPTQGGLPSTGVSDNSSVLISSTRDGVPTALAPFSLVYDGVAPAPATIAAIATDNAVNGAEKQAGVTISGTAEANGSVVVAWGGAQKVASVNAAGAWSASFAAAEVPADGATVVSAVAQDAAGNAAAATTRAVQVESAPPAIAVAAVATDNRVNIAEAGNVVVSGTTAPGAAVSVTWNGIAKPATAAGDGTWSVTYTGAEVPPATPAAPAGTAFPLVVTATTVIGNSASAAPVQVLVDRVAPVAPAIAVVEGDDLVSTLERADGVVVSGTGEAGGTISLNWAGTAKQGAVAANGTWSIAFAANEVPAVAGASTLTATVTDPAGNPGAAATRPVTIAPVLPPPVVAGNIATDGIVNATEYAAGFQITGTVSAGAPGVNVSIAGGPANLAATVTGGNWTVAIPGNTPLAQGSHVVTATIAEPGGQSGTGSFVVDTVGPAAPTIGPVAGDNIVNVAEAGNFTVSGTAEPNARLGVTLGAGAAQPVIAGAGGAWSLTYSPGALPIGGTSNLVVTSADAAGNPGASQTASIAFDLVPPPVPVVLGGTAATGGIALNGTAEAGSTVVVSVLGSTANSPQTLVATAGGTWSSGVFGGLSAGTFSVTVIATDSAGNSSAPGTSLVVILPPAAFGNPSGEPLALDGHDLAGALATGALSNDTLLDPAPAPASAETLAVGDLLHPTSIPALSPMPQASTAPTLVAIGAPDATHAIDALLWHPSA